MTSFDVLDRDLNVFSPLFLEASAGTGKTFAIEHLVTRILLESDTAISIDQILVVTFTRAATRELKMRIRRTLLAAQEMLQANAATLDYLKRICEMGDVAIKESLCRIEAALVCFDGAQIFTLHGFCYRMLKEFAFDAHFGLEVSDPDEMEHLPLIELAVKDFLRFELSAYSPTQIRLLFKQHKNQVGRLSKRLVHAVSQDKEILPCPSFAQNYHSFLAALNAFKGIERDKMILDYHAQSALYKKMTDKRFDEQVEKLAAVAESQECSKEQFDAFLKHDFFLEMMCPANRKVRAKEPTSLHYPDLFHRLRTLLLPSIKSASDPSKIFLNLARDCKAYAAPKIQQKEALSPDHLLRKVEEALSSSHFVHKVRSKYRAAIVDEFQDTDPIQWKILSHLFLNVLEVFCLVGDPKQSIYAFRNADVYTYLKAAQAIGEKNRRQLDTNFRSTSSLINALNLLFCRPSKGWISLPRLEKMLEVSAVKAHHKEGQEGSVHFFVAEASAGRSRKWPPPDIEQSKLFPFIAREILRLKAEESIEWHQFAVLIKDRYQAASIVDYFKEREIPASFKRGGMLIETQGFHAMKELLAAVLSPNDLSKVKAAMGGPLFCWTEEDLRGGLENTKLQGAKLNFQKWRQRLQDQGFGAFFDAVVEARKISEMLSLFFDFRRIAELLMEEESARGIKAEGFLHFLEEMELESEGEEARFKTPPQEERGSVTVMTTHLSKGLEFDTVFAVGLASRHSIKEHMTIRKENVDYLSTFDPEDPLCLEAMEELDAEKMRQLYVAMTRAKKRLYVPLVIDGDKKTVDLGEASPIELFFAHLTATPSSYQELYAAISTMEVIPVLQELSPHVAYSEIKEVSVLHAPSQEMQAPPLYFPNAEPLHFDQQPMFSFTSLAKKKESSIVLPATAPLPLGSETGIIVHRIFEKIFENGWHQPEQFSHIEALIIKETRFTPLADLAAMIYPWILELLQKPLFDGFCLKDISADKILQELEFLFPVEGGLMKGFADLVFEHEGKYYLLDWKTNYLNDYTEESIVRVMKEQDYFLQASIYASALQRYVKLFDTRPFEECYGGAIYYFVRGNAAYHFTGVPV